MSLLSPDYRPELPIPSIADNLALWRSRLPKPPVPAAPAVPVEDDDCYHPGLFADGGPLDAERPCLLCGAQVPNRDL